MNSNAEITKSETDQDFNAISSTSAKITWSVRNLPSLPESADYATDSPPFDFQNARWCLRLYPNRTDSSKNGCIGLTIVRLSSRVPQHTLEYHLKLEDWVTYARCNVADFKEDCTEIGEMNLTSRNVLFSIPHVRRDSIKVTCIVTCDESHSVDTFSQTEFSVQDDAKGVTALGQNLKDLLLNGRDHDIVLKVKDKEFHAHQNILRARSPVMESMLSHDMMEKNSGAIDIPDCDPIAFQQFLIYLYSGRVDNLDAGNMLPLYYIADKYDTGHLKEKCREFIKKSLSTGNITDVVQIALDHSDADLLRWSTDYFVKEMDSILPTVEWLSFMKRNTVQANELVIKATKHMIDLIKMGR